MLQIFLNRIVGHPTLRKDHVVHKFLDSNASWSEVLTSPPISLLPKNILKGPVVDPSAASDDVAYNHLPTPSASGKLKEGKHENLWWVDYDVKTKEFESLCAVHLEKIQRRIVKRYMDMSADYAELGATYNSFSLSENGSLAEAIEKIGQASDSTYLAMQEFARGQATEFGEPLGEFSQTAGIVRLLLKYRHQKALQNEATAETLAQKQTQLDTLERSEMEARRIEGALARTDLDASGQRSAQNVSSIIPPEQESSSAAMDEASESLKPKKRLSGGLKMFGKLNHAIHGIIDVDPQATRRNNIGKTKENIVQVENTMVVLEVC